MHPVAAREISASDTLSLQSMRRAPILLPLPTVTRAAQRYKGGAAAGPHGIPPARGTGRRTTPTIGRNEIPKLLLSYPQGITQEQLRRFRTSV